MKHNIGQALEILRHSESGDSVYTRIGQAITSVIPSEISAIEVFDRSGGYAERRWADPEPSIRQHYERFLAYRAEHPLFQEFVRSGLTAPIKISDRMDMPALLSTGIYNEFFKPLGIQRQMAVALPSDSVGVAVLALGRSGSDYTLQEQDALHELIPNCVEQIAMERALGDRDLLFRALLNAEAAIALVSFHCFIGASTPKALSLLNRYFPGERSCSERLPERIVTWLRSCTANAPHTQCFRSRESQSHLVVSACGNGDRDLIVLKEERLPKSQLAMRFNLSPRLADVLLLLMKGFSNKEIASDLRISPHTVRTLVEQVLFRMSASNRTEAAVMGQGALED